MVGSSCLVALICPGSASEPEDVPRQSRTDTGRPQECAVCSSGRPSAWSYCLFQSLNPTADWCGIAASQVIWSRIFLPHQVLQILLPGVIKGSRWDFDVQGRESGILIVSRGDGFVCFACEQWRSRDTRGVNEVTQPGEGEPLLLLYALSIIRMSWWKTRSCLRTEEQVLLCIPLLL